MRRSQTQQGSCYGCCSVIIFHCPLPGMSALWPIWRVNTKVFSKSTVLVWVSVLLLYMIRLIYCTSWSLISSKALLRSLSFFASKARSGFAFSSYFFSLDDPLSFLVSTYEGSFAWSRNRSSSWIQWALSFRYSISLGVIPGLPLKCNPLIDFDRLIALPKYQRALSLRPVFERSAWIR